MVPLCLKQLRQILDRTFPRRKIEIFKTGGAESADFSDYNSEFTADYDEGTICCERNGDNTISGTVVDEGRPAEHSLEVTTVKVAENVDNDETLLNFVPADMALNTKEGCGEGDGQNFDLEHRNTPANEASDEEDTVEKIRFDPVTGTMTLTSTAFAGDDSHWVGRTEKEVAAEDGGVFTNEKKKLPVAKKRRKKGQKQLEDDLFAFDDNDESFLDVCKRKLKGAQHIRLKNEAVLCAKIERPIKAVFTPEMFKQLMFLRDGSAFPTEDSIYDQFFLDEWCTREELIYTDKENESSYLDRSPCFLSLFNGCFEEEAESLTGEEINARDGNSSSVSGDDADLFAASTDEVSEGQQIDHFSRLFPDHTRQEEAQMDSIALRAELGLLQSDGNPCCSADKMDTTLPKSSNSSCALFEESSFLSLSASEAQLQLQEEEAIAEDPTREVHNINVPVDKIKIQGSHTFSSLLAHVPDFLVGRTAEDINPIDIFCILLHLCNENNLEVVQRHDGNGMTLSSELDDFRIVSSFGDRDNRKQQ
ncbi:unnamed protein product [Enterobius vermicularis]|uniref:Condensin complex subunit 2 n=1 Tax=Enterobius vermicularis TaxID=51028 RepID=A0A0N4V3U7_ENTVE|nr:unnamed protein product [Enterobius vermicularis]